MHLLLGPGHWEPSDEGLCCVSNGSESLWCEDFFSSVVVQAPGTTDLYVCGSGREGSLVSVC